MRATGRPGFDRNAIVVSGGRGVVVRRTPWSEVDWRGGWRLRAVADAGWYPVTPIRWPTW